MKILLQAVLQAVAPVAKPQPAIGGGHAHLRRLLTQQRPDLHQRVQPTDIARRHRLGLLIGPGPLGAGVADHADVGHAALGRGAARALLTHPRGVQLHVGAAAALVVLVPGPDALGAEGLAGLEVLRQPAAGVFGGALDGGLAQTDARHLVQQVGALLEAIGHGASQRGDPLQTRRQVARRQARLLVEREQALAASPTQIIGTRVPYGADETGGGVRAVRVEFGRLLTVGAGHAGALVAVFFRARCCSRALAAILWASARIVNSLAPKRC